MDIKGRILELMTERGWSRYKLAQESGIFITTINSWYKKNYNPSLESLESICSAFGITIIELFSGIDESNLTADQILILQKYGKLPPEWKKKMLELMDFITEDKENTDDKKL